MPHQGIQPLVRSGRWTSQNRLPQKVRAAGSAEQSVGHGGSDRQWGQSAEVEVMTGLAHDPVMTPSYPGVGVME